MKHFWYLKKILKNAVNIRTELYSWKDSYYTEENGIYITAALILS